METVSSNTPLSNTPTDGIDNTSSGKSKGKGKPNKGKETKGKGKGKGNKGQKCVEEEVICLLCAETIDFRSRLSVLAPCGHNEMCSTCALRLRILHKDKRCPCCNIEAESMVATPSSKLSWQDIDIEPEHGKSARWAGGTFQKHSESGLFMPHSFKVSHVDKLISCSCYEFIPQPSQIPSTPQTQPLGVIQPPTPPSQNIQKHHHQNGAKCHANFGNIKALGRHIREKHNLQFCSICAEHKPVFCSELRRYSTTNDELEKHITVGDPKGEGFNGHPKCSWCKERFYDEKALTMHYTKNHFCCHLCDRLGKANKWFRDYAGLDAHYAKDHWPCHDPKCKERRFVAFEDEFQLRLHQQEVHRNTSQRNGRGQPNAIAFNFSNNGVQDHDDHQSTSTNQGENQHETSLIDSVHAFPSLGESLTGPALLTDDCPSTSGATGGGGGGGVAAAENNESGVFVPFGRWGDGASNRVSAQVEAFPTLGSTTTTSQAAKGKWSGKGNKGNTQQPKPQQKTQQPPSSVSWASSRPPTQSSPAPIVADPHAMASEFASQQRPPVSHNNQAAQQVAPTSDDFPILGEPVETAGSGASVKKSKSKSKVVRSPGMLSKLGIPAAATVQKPKKPSTGLTLVRNSAVTRGKL